MSNITEVVTVDKKKFEILIKEVATRYCPPDRFAKCEHIVHDWVTSGGIVLKNRMLNDQVFGYSHCIPCWERYLLNSERS